MIDTQCTTLAVIYLLADIYKDGVGASLEFGASRSPRGDYLGPR